MKLRSLLIIGINLVNACNPLDNPAKSNEINDIQSKQVEETFDSQKTICEQWQNLEDNKCIAKDYKDKNLLVFIGSQTHLGMYQGKATDYNAKESSNMTQFIEDKESETLIDVGYGEYEIFNNFNKLYSFFNELNNLRKDLSDLTPPENISKEEFINDVLENPDIWSQKLTESIEQILKDTGFSRKNTKNPFTLDDFERALIDAKNLKTTLIEEINKLTTELTLNEEPSTIISSCSETIPTEIQKLMDDLTQSLPILDLKISCSNNNDSCKSTEKSNWFAINDPNPDKKNEEKKFISELTKLCKEKIKTVLNTSDFWKFEFTNDITSFEKMKTYLNHSFDEIESLEDSKSNFLEKNATTASVLKDKYGEDFISTSKKISKLYSKKYKFKEATKFNLKKRFLSYLKRKQINQNICYQKTSGTVDSCAEKWNPFNKQCFKKHTKESCKSTCFWNNKECVQKTSSQQKSYQHIFHETFKENFLDCSYFNFNRKNYIQKCREAVKSAKNISYIIPISSDEVCGAQGSMNNLPIFFETKKNEAIYFVDETSNWNSLQETRKSIRIQTNKIAYQVSLNDTFADIPALRASTIEPDIFFEFKGSFLQDLACPSPSQRGQPGIISASAVNSLKLKKHLDSLSSEKTNIKLISNDKPDIIDKDISMNLFHLNRDGQEKIVKANCSVINDALDKELSCP